MMWMGIKERKVLTAKEVGFIVVTWEFSNWFDHSLRICYGFD